VLQDDQELFFASALANPKVRSAIRSHIDDIEWVSPMAESIVEFFTQPSMDGQPFTQNALYAYLLNDYVQPEIYSVISKCVDHAAAYRHDIRDHNTNEVLHAFQRFYYKRTITSLFKDYQANPEKVIEGLGRIRNLNFSTIPIDTLGELDVTKVIEEDMGGITCIPSRFTFIRSGCEPWDGYATGQLVMVCAPPGVGKTLFLAHEVVYMMVENRKTEKAIDNLKKEDFATEKEYEKRLKELKDQIIRVYWIALGDMTRMDFIVRLTAIYKGLSFNAVKLQAQKYFDEDAQDLFKYIKISVVPAGHVDIYGVKHFIENSVIDPTFDPQVVIIDYDANLLSKAETMYSAGEEVYNTATALARPIGKPGKLVFIASQPKIEYWDWCPIPKEAAAESSRKQAIIDMMITIGRNGQIPGGDCGEMLIAKNRRGKEGVKGFYNLAEGHFIMLDAGDYNSKIANTGQGRNPAVKARTKKRYSR
jgi:hypothetical protein